MLNYTCIYLYCICMYIEMKIHLGLNMALSVLSVFFGLEPVVGFSLIIEKFSLVDDFLNLPLVEDFR